MEAKVKELESILEEIETLIKKVKDHPKENPVNGWFIFELDKALAKHEGKK